MHAIKYWSVVLPAFAFALLMPQAGSAIDLVSTNVTTATGNCQAVDSNYAANIKAKALSMDNVGTSGVFVTCALTSDKSALGITSLKISVHNQNSNPATVNCTAVVGTSASPATYYAKSVGISPGAENQIVWTAAGDGGGIAFPHPASVTCSLPANTGITTNEISFIVQLL